MRDVIVRSGDIEHKHRQDHAAAPCSVGPFHGKMYGMICGYAFSSTKVHVWKQALGFHGVADSPCHDGLEELADGVEQSNWSV